MKNVPTNNRTITNSTQKRKKNNTNRIQNYNRTTTQHFKRKKMSIYNDWNAKSWKEKIQPQKEGLVEINIELIQSLKAQGKNGEAQELLKAFRNNCEKMRQVDRRINNSKYKEIKKKHGVM